MLECTSLTDIVFNFFLYSEMDNLAYKLPQELGHSLSVTKGKVSTRRSAWEANLRFCGREWKIDIPYINLYHTSKRFFKLACRIWNPSKSIVISSLKKLMAFSQHYVELAFCFSHFLGFSS